MKLIWTRRADTELLRLVSFVYPRNRSASLKLYGLARSKVLQLLQFPRSGRIGRLEGTREFVIHDTPYIAVCLVEGDVVWIMHVLHAAQQWPPNDD